jgi:hypothetical protein
MVYVWCAPFTAAALLDRQNTFNIISVLLLLAAALYVVGLLCVHLLVI